MMPQMAPPDGMIPPSEMGMLPMPSLVPEDVVRLVDRMEQQRTALHQQMDQDYSRWRLDPYVGDDELDGFAKFTSNDPRAFMDWALTVIGTAKRTVRVHQGDAQQQQRQVNNFKEMFVLGNWQSIDERRANLLQPRLVDAMGWQCGLRGRRAQRVLIIKEIDPNPPPAPPPVDPMSATALEGGEAGMMPQSLPPELMAMMPPPTRSYVDVQDWDPRNTYWMMGRHGVAWACHKSKHTRDEIIAEFGVDPAQNQDVMSPELTGEAEREYWRYEWYDDQVGMVILEDKTLLKPPTPHGMVRVPVIIGMVGSLPPVQANGQINEEDYGQSLYHANRDIYDENNFMHSVMKELSHRSIKSPLVWELQDPARMPDEDARITGTDVPVRIGEKVYPLPPMEMVREAAAYMGSIAAQEQRGSVSHAAFGNLQFQLSGYAINSLRQGIEVALKPILQSVVGGLNQIFNLLCDAYATGNFDTMTLAGRMQGSRRRYFQETITPQMVAEGGILEIDLVPVLPQDDAAKTTVAQMLREDTGSGPLADNRFIREEVLDIQDVDLMERAVLEQMAGTASPTALAFRLMAAAEEQGDMQMAAHWYMTYQMEMMKQLLEQAQLGMMGAEMGVNGSGMGGGNGRNGSSRGVRRPAAGVLPAPAQGLPPPPPTPQQGAIAAPGTPRPNRNYAPQGIPPVVQAWGPT